MQCNCHNSAVSAKLEKFCNDSDNVKLLPEGWSMRYEWEHEYGGNELKETNSMYHVIYFDRKGGGGGMEMDR